MNTVIPTPPDSPKIEPQIDIYPLLMKLHSIQFDFRAWSEKMQARRLLGDIGHPFKLTFFTKHWFGGWLTYHGMVFKVKGWGQIDSPRLGWQTKGDLVHLLLWLRFGC